MNTHTPANSVTGTSPAAGSASGSGSSKPTVEEAKARLLAWGDHADASRAKLISSFTSGVMPLVASGAVGVVGAFAASFFARKRGKGTKPDPAAPGKPDGASRAGGILGLGNLVKVAVWLVPLLLKHQASKNQAKSSQK